MYNIYKMFEPCTQFRGCRTTDTDTNHEQLVNNIKFSIKDTKTVLKISMMIHLVILFLVLFHQAGKFQTPEIHLLLRLSIYTLTMIFIIYHHQKILKPDLPDDNLVRTIPELSCNTSDIERRSSFISISGQTVPEPLSTSLPSSDYSTFATEAPGKTRELGLRKRKASVVLIGKESIINAIKLNGIVGDITQGAFNM